MSKFFSQSTEKKALEARAENSDDSLDTWANVKSYNISAQIKSKLSTWNIHFSENVGSLVSSKSVLL